MTSSSTLHAPTRLLYEVYGRGVVSDIALPALKPAQDVAACLQISSGLGDVWPSSEDLIYEFGSPQKPIYRFTQLGEDYLWTYGGVGAFVIRKDGKSIQWFAADGRREDVSGLLYGPVLGFALGLQGMMCLHGGAVATGEGAVAVLAPSGYGKSTTVAQLLKRQFPLLTDDIVALDFVNGQPWMQPGYPRVKLRPDAMVHHGQGANRECLPLHISWGDKRLVPVELLGVECSKPQPLAASFVLLPVSPESSSRVERLSGMDALVGLLANSYNVNRMTREPALQAAEWDCYQRVAESTPVYLVEAPRDLARLEELTDLMLSTAGIRG